MWTLPLPHHRGAEECCTQKLAAALPLHLQHLLVVVVACAQGCADADVATLPLLMLQSLGPSGRLQAPPTSLEQLLRCLDCAASD